MKTSCKLESRVRDEVKYRLDLLKFLEDFPKNTFSTVLGESLEGESKTERKTQKC